MWLSVLTLLLGVLLMLAIIAANGYFVAQEFAYMSVDRARLGARAKAGDVAAERALKVTGRTSFMLSGAQLGITVTGLMVGYVAEPLVGESLGELLGGAGIPRGVSISVGTVGALLAATVVQMIFGELYPKNLAIASPEPLARRLARSTLIYLAAFGWLITVFDHAANALLRLLRIEPVHDLDTSVTAEELKRSVADSRESGDLPDELSMLIDRVLDFPTRDVEHAMIPRAQVDAVTPETTIGELRRLMTASHTRYPVLGEEDQPLGIVHLVDVLQAENEDDPVTAIMRSALVVPGLMPLPEALAQLTRTRNELACVIDEYGGFSGVLTVEDLAEELIGEITDEHDEPAATVAPEADGSWLVDGELPLDEMSRAIGHDLPAGDFETVAGMLIAERGALPEVGETVRVPLPEDPADLALGSRLHRVLDVEVLAVERHVPSQVRARIAELEDDDESDGPHREADQR
ncbi:hemolysin family protein [Georgenia alba]|uniref:Hemolysin family protein n=1 Tax=Georgenia alba TaxID=2233858 RepID=A0ABW2Q3Z7_9MICO